MGVGIRHQCKSCFPFDSCHLSQLGFCGEPGFPEARLV